MDTPSLALLEYLSSGPLVWEEEFGSPQVELRVQITAYPPVDAETLRRCAWEIGQERPAEAYAPATNHVGLAAVSPNQGFAHWRIDPEWVEQTAQKRGNAWHHCRLVLRLYDVSCIQFNGFNAHRLQDETLPALCGQRFFHLPRTGTSQLAEVGFVLRSGEFIAAARSHCVQFARDGWSPKREQTALFVDERWRIETVNSVWEQEAYLRERRRPKLRHLLRIATFALAEEENGLPATFVRELAVQQRALGHEVHVFVAHAEESAEPRNVDGVIYHSIPVKRDSSPFETAQVFARDVEPRLQEVGSFDLLHHHEWMTGLAAAKLCKPHLLSLTSLEVTRRNGGRPTTRSRAIEAAERSIARTMGCVLTPDWLREQAIVELGMQEKRVRSFPMEGRLANEWECSLDYGQVKSEIGVGPLDRMILYVGPLEHAAGVDLLLEALPTVLRRTGNLRLAFIGSGNMHGHLEQRAAQLGVGYAVRLLGHREGPQVHRLVRASEALILPSRYRVPFDDAVVDLARKAGRAVVTTHAGPAHLVRHEENGLLTYDNPGSMVWALDRLLSDPTHVERMGRNGRRSEGSAQSWSDVTRHYLEVCAGCFPELTVTEM